MSDPRLLGAYLLYYWPVSYAQLRYVLADLGVSAGAALDVGSGPLPATCALLDHNAQSVTAVDVNRAATSLGRKLLPASAKVRFATWNATTTAAPPPGSYDTVVFSHVLNELWPDRQDRIPLRASLMSRIIPNIRPGGRLIIMEPALLALTRDLLTLRDELAGSGWFIESPCFLQSACPARAIVNGTCHAAFAWKPPYIVSTLASRAGIDKSHPAMSYLVARPPGAVGRPVAAGVAAESPVSAGTFASPDGDAAGHDDSPYRVVSDPMRNKAGRTRVFVCGRAGRFAISAGPADVGDAVRTFREAARGDVVAFSGLEARGEGVAFAPGSRFSVLRASSRSLDCSL